MLAAAAKFNVDKIKQEDVARTGAPPDDVGREAQGSGWRPAAGRPLPAAVLS